MKRNEALIGDVRTRFPGITHGLVPLKTTPRDVSVYAPHERATDLLVERSDFSLEPRSDLVTGHQR